MTAQLRMEQKIDNVLEQVHKIDTTTKLTAQCVESLEEEAKQTNGRLGRLERWRNIIIGAGIVVVGILGFLGRVVVPKLFEHLP